MVLLTPNVYPTRRYTTLNAFGVYMPTLTNGDILGSTPVVPRLNPQFAPTVTPPTSNYNVGPGGPEVSMVKPDMIYQRSTLGTYTLSGGFDVNQFDVNQVKGEVDAVNPLLPGVVGPSMNQAAKFWNPSASMGVLPNNASVGYQRMSLGMYAPKYQYAPKDHCHPVGTYSLGNKIKRSKCYFIIEGLAQPF